MLPKFFLQVDTSRCFWSQRLEFKDLSNEPGIVESPLTTPTHHTQGDDQTVVVSSNSPLTGTLKWATSVWAERRQALNFGLLDQTEP